MSGFKTRIVINRPIEDVFAVLTNVENFERWFPGNPRERWTSPPPVGVGSTRHAVATRLGRRSENDGVVTEYDPPRRAAMRGTSPHAPFTVEIDFRPEGRGTRVQVTSELTPRGPARLFGPLIGVLFGWAWRRGLGTFKRMMESGALLAPGRTPGDR